MDLQIESRNVAMTPRWKKEIQQRIADLQNPSCDPIHGRVTLTKNRHHKKQANVAEAVIVVSLPGRTITARKEAKTFEEAIRPGFDAVAIKIRKYQNKRARTHVRTPPIPPLRGVIFKLYPAKGYGFILKEGGGEVYFHKNALHELSFNELEDGLEVAFDMEVGRKGPQATTVNSVPIIQAMMDCE